MRKFGTTSRTDAVVKAVRLDLIELPMRQGPSTDDELGRLNYLTPEARKRATRYVHEGLTFCLSLPLTFPGGTVVHRLRLGLSAAAGSMRWVKAINASYL